jgi:hypothetical protein
MNHPHCSSWIDSQQEELIDRLLQLSAINSGTTNLAEL